MNNWNKLSVVQIFCFTKLVYVEYKSSSSRSSVCVSDRPSITLIEFPITVHCLFCGTPVNVADKKRGKSGSAVQTMVFQNSIKRLCDDRDDEWGREVKGRINTVNDLHAADTIYHQTCSVNFRTKRHIPAPFSPPSAKRPEYAKISPICKARCTRCDLLYITKSHETFVLLCTRCNNHIIFTFLLFKYTKITCDTK